MLAKAPQTQEMTRKGKHNGDNGRKIPQDPSSWMKKKSSKEEENNPILKYFLLTQIFWFLHPVAKMVPAKYKFWHINSIPEISF